MIEVNKNTVAGALTALGKMISRTSPVEAYRSVRIEAKENVLRFRTAGTEECIEFRIEAEFEEEFTVVTGFEEFRQAVRGCRNKSLVMEFTEGHLVIDGIALASVNCEFPQMPDPGGNAKSEVLPENFPELLNTAAPVVNRSDCRKVLQGINLSRDGLTAVNGKELFNVPIPLEVESLTIPFPLALIAAKATGTSRLTYWTDGGSVFFQINIGCWTWSGKAISGTYPNWKLVMPDEAKLEHRVSFTAERAEQMKNWLKNLPDEPVILTRSSDDLVLRDQHGSELRITAYFVQWDDYRIAVNSNILLRLLNEGHTTLACPEEHGPFLASGGAGRYIAMPLHQPQTEPKEEPKETQSNQEENKMETTTPVVSAPMQTAAPKIEPETSLNPLDDLTASIEAFKLKLKASFDEVSSLARKVKEVQIAQKQKERDFIQAKRAIERIRMVSGF